MDNRCGYKGTQSGGSLITTMIVLAVLMLLGVASMVGSDTNYRVAGNVQFENEALVRVENLLTTAESDLMDPTLDGLDQRFASYLAATPQLFPLRVAATDVSAPDPWTGSWDASNSLAVNAGERYRVEMIGRDVSADTSIEMDVIRRSTACRKVNLYRISARAEGARGTTKTAQSVYSRLSCR